MYSPLNKSHKSTSHIIPFFFLFFCLEQINKRPNKLLLIFYMLANLKMLTLNHQYCVR